MYVYFAQRADTKLVKIGTTRFPEKRIAAIRCEVYPSTLSVLRVIDGSYEAEREMHRRFAPYSRGGEWFVFHPEMMTATMPPRDDFGTDDDDPSSLDWIVSDTLRRLERHARRSGLTEHKAGVAVCGSGTLFKRLRAGNVTIRTLRTVSDWLDAAEAMRAAAE